MKSLLLGSLDYSAAKILAAANQDGVARVRGRDGRVYVVRPEPIAVRKRTGCASFARSRRAGLKKSFPDGPVMTAVQIRDFDRLVATDRASP
jgi:hypothetical protein